MQNRLNEKAGEIESFLLDLEETAPDTFEEYLNDKTKKAACERYAEKIIEAAIDLAFMAVRHKNLVTPEEEEKAFDTLSKSNIITETLAKKLKEAKGMRNILAHEYGKIDDRIIFHAIKEELTKDVSEFLKEIQKIS